MVLDLLSIFHNVKRGTRVNFDPKLMQVNFTGIIQFWYQTDCNTLNFMVLGYNFEILVVLQSRSKNAEISTII